MSKSQAKSPPVDSIPAPPPLDLAQLWKDYADGTVDPQATGDLILECHRQREEIARLRGALTEAADGLEAVADSKACPPHLRGAFRGTAEAVRAAALSGQGVSNP